MKRNSSTIFLRLVLIAMGLVSVFLATLIIVETSGPGWEREMPKLAFMQLPFLILTGVSAIVFIAALVQAYKLLMYIDKNIAFSVLSVKALKNIKISALVMTGVLWLCQPAVFAFAELDDAPGLIIVGAAFASAPIVVAVFAAVLQKLVQNAIEIKSENELTV
jgi:hypothetical protein